MTVLPWDEEGRVLLVRDVDTHRWMTIGGAVEIDESPADAAIRETYEEAGVEVTLGRIRAALGGPGFVVDYPNGDRTAYVCIVYDATVLNGTPRADEVETSATRWVLPADLRVLDLGPFARETFNVLGLLPDEHAEGLSSS